MTEAMNIKLISSSWIIFINDDIRYIIMRR